MTEIPWRKTYPGCTYVVTPWVREREIPGRCGLFFEQVVETRWRGRHGHEGTMWDRQEERWPWRLRKEAKSLVIDAVAVGVVFGATQWFTYSQGWTTTHFGVWLAQWGAYLVGRSVVLKRRAP